MADDPAKRAEANGEAQPGERDHVERDIVRDSHHARQNNADRQPHRHADETTGVRQVVSAQFVDHELLFYPANQ